MLLAVRFILPEVSSTSRILALMEVLLLELPPKNTSVSSACALMPLSSVTAVHNRKVEKLKRFMIAILNYLYPHRDGDRLSVGSAG